jgi:transcription elongation factor Elf1
MHDETIFTTCERCNRGFNLSNQWVKLDGATAFCPHCGQRPAVDAEALERARRFRGEK